MKRALIFGVTGQAGSYLAKHLLELGYMVFGVKRRTSIISTDRINAMYIDPHHFNDTTFQLMYGDVTDYASVIRAISKSQPDEIYNLAAQSHVQVSFENPGYTAQTTAIGAHNIIDALSSMLLLRQVKVIQASSSEMFGKVLETPQNENTPFNPQSPYAISKVYAHHIMKNYREAYKMWAANAIFFNMESPYRGETFVTRKITMAVAKIACGFQSKVYLGNLDAKRDWGHCKDYMRGMHLIAQQPIAEDFCFSTGITTTVRDFAKMAFDELGIGIEFSGTGDGEIGTVVTNRNKHAVQLGQPVIKIHPDYYRPSEVDLLLGDSTKARTLLNWEPEYDLKKLVNEMVWSDFEIQKANLL